VTEPGGTGGASGAGNRPPDQPTSGGWNANQGTPADPGSTPGTAGDELPRWQPFSDAPTSATPAPPSPAMPDESMLTPAPTSDSGGMAPEQLYGAPTYVPLPGGMSPGPVMPPTNPADVPSSAWITTGPQAAAPPRPRNRLVNIVGGVIGLLIVLGVVAGVLGLLPSDKGKILFGTAAGKDLCSVSNQSTTVKTTDPIFFAAILKHHMDGAQAIVFHITRDGAEFISHDEPADGTEFDCYGNRESLGALEPGTYVFQVIHKGDIEATGTLIVQ
jgi:hypothetical protein